MNASREIPCSPAPQRPARLRLRTIVSLLGAALMLGALPGEALAASPPAGSSGDNHSDVGTIAGGSTSPEPTPWVEPPLAPDGAACDSAALCESGFCIDGVCCTSACGGGAGADCEACDLPGFLGACLPVSAGTVCRASAGACDVAAACDGESFVCPSNDFLSSETICRASAGTCDVPETCTGGAAACPEDTFAPASRVCRKSAGACDLAERCTGASAACPEDAVALATVVCGQPSCEDGKGILAVTCDGSAPSCPPTSMVSCGAFACGVDACLTECKTAAECLEGHVCEGGACKAARVDGDTCSASAQCGSGHCVDGVCCNTACEGQCEACDLSSTPGVCSPVAGPPHGTRAACESDGSVCGGTCDGGHRHACAMPGAEIRCRDASCDAHVAIVTASCDGSGACPSVQLQACAPFLCGDGACAGDCAVDDDCAANNFCNAGVCVGKRVAGAECWATHECASGSCVDGVCCTSACDGQCEACDLPGLLGTCSPVIGDPHGTRPTCATDGGLCGGTCDGEHALRCAYPDASITCRSSSCTDGVATLHASCNGAGSCPVAQHQSCGDFDCGSNLCMADCTTDSACQDGSFCAGGVCVTKLAAGAACAGENQCGSGFCVDGVCCNAACNGQCEACNSTPNPGVCLPVSGAPHGARQACSGLPGSTCGGQCDGADAKGCSYPAAETTCRPGSCMHGLATLPTACDGQGLCPEMEKQSCGTYACGADACLGDCDDDSGCAGGSFCSAGICQPKHLVGLGCTSDAACGSGHCVDGVCCATACDGQCEACDLAGSEGTCAPVIGVPHGGRDACAGQGTCAGQCDGMNAVACTFPAAETTCAAASCTDAVSSPAATCDGAGTCAAAAQQSCGDYACGAGTTCLALCTSDAQCVNGTVCTLGLCGTPAAASCAFSASRDEERGSSAPLLLGLAALVVSRLRRRS